MSYKDEMSQLKKYRDIATRYCRTVNISPYQLMLLSLVDGEVDYRDVEFKLTQSEFYSNDSIKWYTITGNDKRYSLKASKYVYKDSLVDKGLVLYEVSSSGPYPQASITLTDRGKEVVLGWTENLHSFFKDLENNKEKEERIAAEITKALGDVEVDGDDFNIDIDSLPEEISKLMKENAEEGYFKLCEKLLGRVSDITTDKKAVSLPVFLNLSSQKVSSRRKDYYKGGLTHIKGWVTSFSKDKTINMGAVYTCSSASKHVSISGEDISLCGVCGENLTKVTQVNMPIFEVSIETSGMEKIDAIIHADLWRPGESLSTEHKMMIFKLKEKGRFKEIKGVKYMIAGIEKAREKKVSHIKAKEIASKPTKEILQLIDNSIFYDLSGSEITKKAAILTLASINTQNMNVMIKDRWKKERGIINTLFWGVEGTAKTQIAQRMVDLVSHTLSKGQAGGSSVKGLTAGYDADVKGIRTGLIPMNDTRAVLIDEIDKYKDFSEFLQPLEEKKFDYAKANVKVTYKCNTVIFMTGNNRVPIEGNALEQMKRELERRGGARSPILDRCDIICVIRSKTKGSDILAEWIKAPKVGRTPKEDIENYFEALRLIKEVSVDSNALRYLFGKVRKEGIELSARRIYSLLRIATAVAKLHLRTKVQSEDLNQAISFYSDMLVEMGITTFNTMEIDKTAQFNEMKEAVFQKLKKVSLTEEDLREFFPNYPLDTIVSVLKKERLIYVQGLENQLRAKK